MLTGLTLKPYLPRSLFGRAILILIVPIVALQMVVAIVFIQRHFEDVTQQMTRSIAREIAVALQVIDTSPSGDIAQLRLNNLSRPLALRLGFDEAGTLEAENSRVFYDLSGRALTAELQTLLGPDISVDLASDSKVVDLRVQTSKGVLHAIIPRVRVTASNPHQLLVLMITAALLLIVIAVLFLRNQVRPIRDLANAAEAFGKGRSEPFRPAGAEEVRRAGNAFLSMRGRLERQIEQRTQMLSGVSHDLRTPLTRMKLTLALVDDQPEIAELTRDVDDMERMLDEFLAFARGDQLEDVVTVDAVEFVDDIVEMTRRSGKQISLSCSIEDPESKELSLRKGAVQRAVQNLINNAAHYGTRVRLSLRLLAKTVEFVVEDNGPGIPKDAREAVMRPFARLDASRNQNKGGGVGLGLSIAQDVARSHGGVLELGDSADLGGLKACLRIPR